MIEISQQETAVLGLLFEHHHYAYRIEEIMQKRGMHNWTDIDYISIKSILKKLEDNKLVGAKFKEEGNDQSKKIYYITDNGKSVLKEKIKSILSKQSKLVYPFDLGLANISVLNQEELLQSLEIYLCSIDERIQSLEYAVKIQEENKIPFNFIAIYSRSLGFLKAEKKWVMDFIEKIENI